MYTVQGAINFVSATKSLSWVYFRAMFATIATTATICPWCGWSMLKSIRFLNPRRLPGRAIFCPLRVSCRVVSRNAGQACRFQQEVSPQHQPTSRVQPQQLTDGRCHSGQLVSSMMDLSCTVCHSEGEGRRKGAFFVAVAKITVLRVFIVGGHSLFYDAPSKRKQKKWFCSTRERPLLS